MIIVDKPLAYAEHFDLIGAINGSKPIACMSLTSANRKAKDIQGARKEVIHEWIIKSLYYHHFMSVMKRIFRYNQKKNFFHSY